MYFNSDQTEMNAAEKNKKKTDEGDLPSHIFNIANYLAFYRFIQKKLKWFLNKLKRKSICWLPWRYHWFGIIRNIVLFMSTATKLHTHTWIQIEPYRQAHKQSFESATRIFSMESTLKNHIQPKTKKKHTK